MYEDKRQRDTYARAWNPDYLIHSEIIKFLPRGHVASVLDYGAGNSPFRSRISCESYLKADITQNTRHDIDYIIQPGVRLNIPDATFDMILLLDVLEHVEDPIFVLADIRRLLKARGRVIISIPFLNREHETPHDFVRYTGFGIRALLNRSGAEVIRIKKIGNVNYTLFTLFLERAIENGEKMTLTILGRILNRVAIFLIPVLKAFFSKAPSENAGIYHHLLLEITFP